MSTSDLKEFLDEWQYKIFLLFVFLVFVFQILKALYRELGSPTNVSILHQQALGPEPELIQACVMLACS